MVTINQHLGKLRSGSLTESRATAEIILNFLVQNSEKEKRVLIMPLSEPEQSEGLESPDLCKTHLLAAIGKMNLKNTLL